MYISLTSAIILILLFIYRKAVKKTAKQAETMVTVACEEMEVETLVLAKAHRQNVKERLMELQEEAQEVGLDKIDLDQELADFRKQYGIRK